MAFEFLLPVTDVAIAHIQLLHHQCIGNTIRVHSHREGFPDLEGVQIALVGLRENRRDRDHLGEKLSFTEIRRAFYELFPGNWHTVIADLGDIDKGESIEDTYFAVRNLTESLVKKILFQFLLVEVKT